MATDLNIADLEIIGYANVLKETMLPSIVPPVFRLKNDPRRAFLPPYFFNAGLLHNSNEVHLSELEHLRDSREITLFDPAFPARAGFELWIDQSFNHHYESREHVKQTLRQIATEAIANSKAALTRGDLKQAERWSGVAMSANDRRVEPLAIRAAIRRIENNKTGERLMAELAEPFMGEGPFNQLVDTYERDFNARDLLHAIPESSQQPPMYKMACLKAA